MRGTVTLRCDGTNGNMGLLNMCENRTNSVLVYFKAEVASDATFWMDSKGGECCRPHSVHRLSHTSNTLNIGNTQL